MTLHPVPEGHPRIARRFNAGIRPQRNPVPKGRLKTKGHFRPSLHCNSPICPQAAKDFEPQISQISQKRIPIRAICAICGSKIMVEVLGCGCASRRDWSLGTSKPGVETLGYFQVSLWGKSSAARRVRKLLCALPGSRPWQAIRRWPTIRLCRAISLWQGIILLWGSTLAPARAADAALEASRPPPAEALHRGKPARREGEVQFDHASGFCSSAFNLGLSAPFPDAAIYYTTNGATPGPAAGIRYDRPVPIAGTAIVRAAAFGGETALTEVAARTYLFVADLPRQTGRGFPDSWGASQGKPVPAHYGMSASLADSPASRAACLEGLRSLPSLSIITDPENLFSPETGLYTHPAERGGAWERPVSVELLCPDGSVGFRIQCGLRIHGGLEPPPRGIAQALLPPGLQGAVWSGQTAFSVFWAGGSGRV